MAKTDRVAELVEPMAAAVGARVYDVTMNGGKLVVALTREGGIDLDTLTSVSRELGRELDEADLVAGAYTLEVTSPGLERTLRTAEHLRGAVGEQVTVRTRPGVDGDRRARGVLRAVGDGEDPVVSIAVDDGTDGVDVRELRFSDIDKARTVFSWDDAAPKPGGPRSGRSNPRTDRDTAESIEAGPHTPEQAAREGTPS